MHQGVIRRVGGLEAMGTEQESVKTVIRRVGGLEVSADVVAFPFIRYPPCRRFRS